MTHLQKKKNSNPFVPFEVIIIGGLILTGIFLTYRNALDNFFIGDDFPWIYHVVKMRYHFVDGLLERYTWMGSTILFYLNLLIFGTDAWGYNLTNLLIHLGNVIFVGLLGYSLTRDKLVGLLAMLLWGINAQGSEAILWKTGRGHSLVLFFMLGALVLFTAWDQKRKNWLYVSALLFAACAHLTLFNAVVLPGIMGAYLIIFKGFPRTLQRAKEYLKAISPFIMLACIYMVFYLFVYTPLSPSQYYDMQEFFLLKFGKYVFNYISIFPDYFIHITYNEEMLLYCGIVTIVAFIAALLFIKNKAFRFSLIFMAITMLPYLPVLMSVSYQPSRYRYMPLVGFNMILAIVLVRLRNIPFSSEFIRKSAMVIGTLFIVIFLVGNIYYITLDELDYDRYGKSHQTLVNRAQAILNQLPLDHTIVFINFSNLNVPALDFEQLYKAKVWFPRSTAPWKLVYIDHLLTFCAYADKKEGLFILQDKQKASQNILEGKYRTLAFSDTGFFFPQLAPSHIEKILKALAEQEQQAQVTVLQYIIPTS